IDVKLLNIVLTAKNFCERGFFDVIDIVRSSELRICFEYSIDWKVIEKLPPYQLLLVKGSNEEKEEPLDDSLFLALLRKHRQLTIQYYWQILHSLNANTIMEARKICAEEGRQLTLFPVTFNRVEIMLGMMGITVKGLKFSSKNPDVEIEQSFRETWDSALAGDFEIRYDGTMISGSTRSGNKTAYHASTIVHISIIPEQI
ncbi:hypothetical protein PFISCL1PPCAC_12125, partial [Pristionchus fissidentatus]